MRRVFPHGVVNDLDEDGSSGESIDEWGSVVGSGQDGSWSQSMAIGDWGCVSDRACNKSTVSDSEEGEEGQSNKLEDNY